MAKEFECFWGAGYRGDDNKSTLEYHPLSFFSEENGYSKREIDCISNLVVGEGYEFNSVFQEHWTRRIK